MIDRIWRLFTSPFQHLPQWDRLQLQLECIHSEARKLDALHRADIKRSLHEWERKGGRNAWETWVDWERKKLNEAVS